MPQWHKLGRLYDPSAGPRHPKLLTHAANPLPVHVDGDVFRIFFSGRDDSSRSSVGAVDIDIVRRMVVMDHYEPVFTHGPIGSFYADGVSLGNCYGVGDDRYILFMGWQAPAGAQWRGDIGRLRLSANLELRLDGTAPFMGSDEQDPLSLSYPWVMTADGGGYRMWYGSTISWDAGNGEMLHVLQHAQSCDGHSWTRLGLAVPYILGVAQAFSRPAVARNSNGTYAMWFSYRGGDGQRYRIGYASSSDGLQWRLRVEDSCMSTSTSGWDSEMIEYPFVFDHKGVRYMLYNGNGYGRSGFGLAVWDMAA